ncbi:hypothetical protein NGM37_57950, partial [Streptomyces sp. TRM76130]|nr:hypothetical protein [Streptomyces sp. TRM76130]
MRRLLPYQEPGAGVRPRAVRPGGASPRTVAPALGPAGPEGPRERHGGAPRAAVPRHPSRAGHLPGGGAGTPPPETPRRRYASPPATPGSAAATSSSRYRSTACFST